MKSYEEIQNKDTKANELSKRSKYALMCSLLALIFAVFISLGHV